MSRMRLIISFAGLLVFCISCIAAEATRHEIIREIEYARVGAQALKLDLHMPPGKPHSPLIVWVHGGAWRSGARTDMPLGKLVEDGYAIASVDYRLATKPKFPAQ